MCLGTFSRRGAVASATIYPCAECASSRSVFIVWKRSFLYDNDKKVPCTPYDVHGTLQRGSTHFADLQQQSAALLMITESPCPIKDRSEMVFIRDLCQNASSTALQCRYRRFSLIQIPGLLFSSTRCLFIKYCPYLNRSVSICKEPLIIYFCRSTFCTSCRCRRDRDHWDKSLLPLRWW